ncbi:twin-arginine translocation signal domain-containing protein [Pseudonocardia nematodicida]|uniref:Twin-arginine translocation signal domain-containing protein n=1 Tax=Pseudonocardia nematodicida TaxID=1206997 RepID=A0ABV1KHS4_9PSEU
MPSRRQFLVGTSGAVAGAAVLPALAGTAFAQDPVPPAPAPAERRQSSTAYAAERLDRQSPINIATSQVPSAPIATVLQLEYPTSVSCHVEYISKDTAPAGCSVRRDDETVEALDFSRPAFAQFGPDRYRLI